MGHLAFHERPFIFAAMRMSPFITCRFLVDMQIHLHAAIAIFNIGVVFWKRAAGKTAIKTDLAIARHLFAIAKSAHDIAGMIGKGPREKTIHNFTYRSKSKAALVNPAMSELVFPGNASTFNFLSLRS